MMCVEGVLIARIKWNQYPFSILYFPTVDNIVIIINHSGSRLSLSAGYVSENANVTIWFTSVLVTTKICSGRVMTAQVVQYPSGRCLMHVSHSVATREGPLSIVMSFLIVDASAPRRRGIKCQSGSWFRCASVCVECQAGGIPRCSYRV